MVLSAPARAGGGGKKRPAQLFSADDEGAVDPAAVMDKVDREIARGRTGKGRRLTLTAVSTTEWGCECLPFVYAPFAQAAPEGARPYFFPIARSGLDPARFLPGGSGGTFEMVGRFDGRSMTFAEWSRARKARPSAPEHPDPAFQAAQPVFAVESWCFRRASGAEERYGDELARMRKAGVRFCK